MLWGQAALDGGLGVGFVAHFALDHADVVGTKNAGDGGQYAGDDGTLGGGQGALQDLVDNVHYVVDGGGDEGAVGGKGFRHVESEILGLLVELEGFFDGASKVESGHLVKRGSEFVVNFAHKGRVGEKSGYSQGAAFVYWNPGVLTKSIFVSLWEASKDLRHTWWR